MIRLEVLGGSRLVREDGTEIDSVLRQPKQLALLTYLAIARPRGFHRRDSLLAHFWPELDDEHARGALSQALYRLRRSLPPDVVAVRGRAEVGLAEDALWCDVVEFERALDADRPRDALELYRGDLLDGVHLSGSDGWLRWSEEERRRLRSRAGEGAWAAATRAAEQGDTEGLLRWGLRSLELMPTDEARLRTLLLKLHGLGDRTAAVYAYERATALLADEYEIDPSPETRDLIAEVRAPVRGAPALEGRAGEPMSSIDAVRRPRVHPHEDRAHATVAGGGPDHKVTEDGSEIPETRRRPHPLPWLAVAVLALSALWWAARISVPSSASPSQPAVESSSGDVVERAYRQGRYALLRADRQSLLTALEHFETALETDAGHAPAWAGLSSTYLRLTNFATLPSEDGYPRARSAAERALALDPELAEAHANLATVLALYDWDTDSADVHFRRALETAPDSAHILHRYSAYLRNLGRFDEALVAAGKAVELDPLAPLPRIAVGGVHYVAGRYDEAIETYRKLLEADPDDAVAHKFIALAASMRGSYAEALQALERYDPQGPRDDTHAIRGYIHARQGDVTAARRALTTLEREFAGSAGLGFHKALVLVGLGEHDTALDLLEASLERRTWHLRVLGTDPHFAPLRSNPRFEALLTALDLAG